MIVHIDKLIRHLRSQIESADKVDSEFVYLTKREAEGCLELAEAQDVIQEMFVDAVKCKDCRYWKDEILRGNHSSWLPCKDVQTRSDFYCADGKRKG